MMKLSDVPKCLQYLVFPCTNLSVDWKEESFQRSLLSEIFFEELLQEERKQASINRLTKQEDTISKQSGNAAQYEAKAAGGVEDSDSLFDEEVEELLVIPSGVKSGEIPSTREIEFKIKAKERSEAAETVDVNTFCLLCNRLINTIE